jgi:outer membrane protein TolC
MVRQPLPPAGRRAAERQVAAATTRAAEDELAAEERALVGEIRRGWAEVWRLQEERRLLEEAHPLVELVVESAQARLAGGGERLSGVLDARAELRRHEIEQGEVEARWLEAQSRLGELAGFETGGAFPRVPELVELPSPEPELAAAAAASPRVAAALARVELARAELGLARSERRAATSVGVGVRSVEGDGAELTLAGGVELPIFRRRRAAARIAAAEHALAAAEAEARGARLAVKGELERLYLERVRVDRQLERLREGLLLESSASFEAARTALLDGTGSVADASHHLALWIEARLDESRLLAERFSTRAAIVALVADDADAGGRP